MNTKRSNEEEIIRDFNKDAEEDDLLNIEIFYDEYDDDYIDL